MKSITLQSSDSVISNADVLGRLGFAASSESDGADSVLVAAIIEAVAEGNFTQTSNATSLVFSTAFSSTAEERLKITSEGHFIPFASGQYDLGSPNYHFRNIYANNIIGDYSGQLDGNLDLNNYDIVGTGNITIDGNVTAEYFYGDLDGVVITECRNDTGSTIAEGTPVYIAGYYSSNGKPLVAPADCANAAKMPAIGLLASDLSTGSEGHVHVFGLAQNLPSAVTNGFSVGNTVYVDNGGGLTNVRPTGVSELVQNIGRVLKTGTNGRILVLGPGRSNDVPNSGHFEQLTVDGYTALAVDNGNVGIGTASPTAKFEVEHGSSLGYFSGGVWYAQHTGGGDSGFALVRAGSAKWSLQNDFSESDAFHIRSGGFGGSSRLKMTSSETVLNEDGNNVDLRIEGNGETHLFQTDANKKTVGIGQSDPTYKLFVKTSNSNLDEDGLFIRGVGVDPAVMFMGQDTNESYITAKNNGILELNADIFSGAGGSAITFNVDDSEVMRVDYQDRVGIGTASPQAKLDVNGTVEFDDLVRWEYPDKSLDTSTSTLGYMRLYDEAGAYCGLGVSTSSFNVGTSGAINLRFVTDAIERIIVESNGNTVINELGYPVNFRVEGDADQNLLLVKGAGGADKVGVGTASLYGKLNTAQTTTNQSNQQTFDIRSNNYSTSNGQYYTFGEYIYAKKYVNSGIADTGYTIGTEITSVLADEGSLSAAYGLRTYAGINNESDNGNLTAAYGVQSRVINYSQGTGNINTARGIDVYINGDLSSPGNGGITNAYGVYIQSILNSTNTYGLYQVGSSDKNYFAGDVGIGTTSPLSKLHVRDTTDSDCQIVVDNGTARAKLQTLSNICYAGTITDHDFVLRTNNTTRITLRNSSDQGLVLVNPLYDDQDFEVRGASEDNLIYVDAGANNVGIGIGVPTQRLHVYEAGNAQVLVDDGTVKTKVQSLAGQSKGIVGTNSNHDLEFRTNNNGKMIIKAGGDVGIGVTSPSARLDINSNKLRLRTAKTPSSSSDTGNAGDICWDGNYIYVCVSTNTWKRSSLSTW